PHEEVKPFFDLIDIFVVSRPDSVVTRLVTPLKPFEAMAMGKTVVASDLPALREIISHNETGLLFEAENLENLTDTIESCIVNEELRNNLSKQALEFVNTERSWDKVTEGYRKIYSVLRKSR
ncbi:MAG: glycosyltransferase, partial [Candidatus Poseidoniaceae archaeon]